MNNKLNDYKMELLAVDTRRQSLGYLPGVDYQSAICTGRTLRVGTPAQVQERQRTRQKVKFILDFLESMDPPIITVDLRDQNFHPRLLYSFLKGESDIKNLIVA